MTTAPLPDQIGEKLGLDDLVDGEVLYGGHLYAGDVHLVADLLEAQVADSATMLHPLHDCAPPRSEAT